MHEHDSGSEADPDYIPDEAIDSQSSDEEPDPKRARTSPPQLTDEDKDEERRKRDTMWAEFQASLSAPRLADSSNSKLSGKMVKIERCFRYAGEDVVEIKQVPEDSEEAKKWPRWHPLEERATVSDNPQGQTSSTASSSFVKPTPKRPGPRKPKTPLAPLPKTQKAKKLTTLDKSAMDWRTHVENEDKSELKDELEANRRGGGYLGKVEFLQRVEERKAGALDASKTKRRRV